MLTRDVYKSTHFFPETTFSVLSLEGRGAEVQQARKLARERKAEPEGAAPNGRIEEEH